MNHETGPAVRTITFSRNVFLPVTNVCRNKCAYCSFRRNSSDPDAHLMTADEVRRILETGVLTGCTEALFTFGEYADADPVISKKLSEYGYASMTDYVLNLSKTAIGLGILPHTNAGILSFDELGKLGPYNAGMGLMLETTAPAGRIRAHRDCPGKVPAVRLEVIRNAGRLKIPFTTGLLIGIGETVQDREESLEEIAALHRRYGHIQEVIIQNFTPGKRADLSGMGPGISRGPSLQEMKDVISKAAGILPPDVAVQVAPNLIDPVGLLRLGVTDLGGISPLTIDHINPESAWPDIEKLRKEIEAAGCRLRERLPVHAVMVRKGMYGEKTKELILRLSDEEGFRRIRYV